jgi:hypothetical protein
MGVAVPVRVLVELRLARRRTEVESMTVMFRLEPALRLVDHHSADGILEHGPAVNGEVFQISSMGGGGQLLQTGTAGAASCRISSIYDEKNFTRFPRISKLGSLTNKH